MMYLSRAVFGCWIIVITVLIEPCYLRPSSEELRISKNNWKKQLKIDELRRNEAERVKSYMNTTIHPCDDFYEYACGNFVNSLDSFDGETVSVFSEIAKMINTKTASILSDETNEPSDISVYEKKVKDFYKSCIESSLDKNIDDTRQYLKELGDFPLLNSSWSQATSNIDWLLLAAQVHLLGANSVIMEEVGRSPHRDENVLFIGPQEPSDVNFEDLESKNKLIYEGFISRRVAVYLTVISDISAARRAAQDLFHFEEGRVKIFGRDYHGFEQDYIEIDYGHFREKFPDNDWDKFFQILLGYPITDSFKIVIRYSQFLQPLLDYVAKTDPKVIANYMLYEMLDKTLVSYLSTEPSVETCSEEVEASLHYILTAMFIRNHYNNESRENIEEITMYLNESARNLIHNSDWLDKESKFEAEKKLDKMKLLNGYIDELVQVKWLDENFRNLQVTPNNFIKNLISVRQHVTQMKETIVTKSQSILPKYYLNFYNFNAFYYYGVNVLAVPLGFQNLPVYHPHMPTSYNFGSFGSFIGHEITHAFDSGGRKYDADGNVRNWWSNSSNEAFMQAAQCFVDAYSKYTISNETDAYIDGKVTLPENIADHGGVKESYHAYKKWLEDNRHRVSSRSEVLPGLELSNWQVFFLSYAQFWCGYVEPSDYASVIRTDHSPGKFRVLGVLSNFEEFSQEFNCPIGSVMNPMKKCEVW